MFGVLRLQTLKVAATLSALAGLTCCAIERPLRVGGRNPAKAQAQGPGHYHKEAPTLVGPKETLLSVLTFQSADAKLWPPREETKSAYVGLTPLFSKAKGQGGPAGDKTVSSLTSGEADRSWEPSPAPPDILSCRQTLVAAPSAGLWPKDTPADN